METRVAIVAFLLVTMAAGVRSASFTFINKCPYTVWGGTLTNAGQEPLNPTGFKLANGASLIISTSPQWAGRFWGRTGCSTDASGRFTCLTGDCGSGTINCNGAGAAPPASLVEFTLNGSGGNDFYDTSLVDGFNVPVSVTPQGGACATTGCVANVNALCPPELRVTAADGRTVACKSACLAFNDPKYCCTGAFDSPVTCPPTNYSQIFKTACPQAYSYAYDDKTSTFTCPTRANYMISFCP